MENDLPSGAKRHDEKEVRKVLDALRQKDIDFYERTQRCTNGGVQYLQSFGAIESGEKEFMKHTDKHKMLFNDELHPEIDEVNYYRGIAIPRKNGTILLYTPWIPKQRKETFQVYTVGKVNDAEVLEVVKAYSERMGKHIDRVLAREENEEKQKSVSLESFA